LCWRRSWSSGGRAGGGRCTGAAPWPAAEGWRGSDGPPFLPSLRDAAHAALRGIALFVLLASVAATSFYYLRVGFIGEVVPDDAARRSLEADRV
jgi:hypothetical protein